jgi:DNA-binding CsgD family transcriptional regulator/tetratricopeptide (TPR) repeat protein
LDASQVIESGSALVGRERECAQIEQLLQAACQGQSGSLVIRGEPGIGKSSLLGFAAASAGPMLVLSASGVSTESGLPFAGLLGVLRPVLPLLDRVPETQAAALSAALGLAPPSEPDRFLISAACLSLLAAAAEDRPVLCLIDDAQWLDRPSVDALVFVARRLHADSVALLFAARDGDARGFDASGLPELRLGGLDDQASSSLLERRTRGAPDAVRARLLAEAAGNPLALVELPAALTDKQLSAKDPLPEAIPLTPRLQAVFRERAHELPVEGQMMLLLCAAEGHGDAATILRAAAELGLTADALDPAERSGLIRAGAGRISFRHPLVRSAVYEAAPLSQRQRAHAALATALTADDELDRRVWHQAMAAVTGDEDVAGALERAARRAQRRAAHASAASAFQRAAELSRDGSRVGPRLAFAAQAAWDAGQPDRALELIIRSLRLADDGPHARLLHLRGVIEARCGNLRDAAETLREAAQLSADPSLTLEILHEAAEAAASTGDRQAVAELGARAAELPVVSARDTFSQAVLTGFAVLYAGDYQAARNVFDRALELAGELEDDPRTQIWAAIAASTGIRLGYGLPFTTKAVTLTRSQGRLSLLPIALEQHALELLWNARMQAAYAAAEEGYRLTLDMGQGWGWHLAVMAHVEAIWGREADARTHAERVLTLAHGSGQTFLATHVRATLGLLDLTLGRPEDAVDALLELTTADREDLDPLIAARAVPDAVEAVVRAGRPRELADAPLERLRVWVDHAPSDTRRAALARCEALVERRPPAEAFAEAMSLIESFNPLERARTELLYGEWLRRERRPTDARAHLRAAAELFHSIGAAPWEDRAQAELRATGQTARKREPSTLDQLTPQERQISQLVAEGMTNREIAAQLFLSPHTIEYHLRKVFVKLGITSRTELIRQGPSRFAEPDSSPTRRDVARGSVAPSA